MKEEIRQILKNQRDMMRWIGTGSVNTNYFSQRVRETTELLDSEPNAKANSDHSPVSKSRGKREVSR